MKNLRSLLSSDVSKLGTTRAFSAFSIGKRLKTRTNFKLPFHFFLHQEVRLGPNLVRSFILCNSRGSRNIFLKFQFFGQFWGPNVEILPIFSAKISNFLLGNGIFKNIQMLRHKWRLTQNCKQKPHFSGHLIHFSWR